MTTVVQLAPHNGLTPNEAVEFVSRMAARGELVDVLIVGYTADGCEFRVGSKMPLERAVFLVERAKHNMLTELDASI